MSYEVSFNNGTSLIVDTNDEDTARRVANERGVGFSLKNLSATKAAPKKAAPKKAAPKKGTKK